MKISSWKWRKLSEENLAFATTFLIKIINKSKENYKLLFIKLRQFTIFQAFHSLGMKEHHAS
jgi:hypothetical protein